MSPSGAVAPAARSVHSRAYNHEQSRLVPVRLNTTDDMIVACSAAACRRSPRPHDRALRYAEEAVRTFLRLNPRAPISVTLQRVSSFTRASTVVPSHPPDASTWTTRLNITSRPMFRRLAAPSAPSLRIPQPRRVLPRSRSAPGPVRAEPRQSELALVAIPGSSAPLRSPRPTAVPSHPSVGHHLDASS